MNAVRLGQIVVRDVSETTLRTAFPDCEIAAVGADLQITFELRDLPETYPLLDRIRQTGATLVSPIHQPLSGIRSSSGISSSATFPILGRYAARRARALPGLSGGLPSVR